MSVYPSAFCTYLSQITTPDLTILSSLPSPDPITSDAPERVTLINSLGLIANSKGTITDSNINLTSFYNWWQNPINSGNIATIISTNVKNDTTACQAARKYNDYLLQIFFCNNAPGKNFSPRIEGTNSSYSAQLASLHLYFIKQGGSGLGYCQTKTPPLLQSFCSDITPDGQNVSQFIAGNPKYFSWCGCYSLPSEFADKFKADLDTKEKLACNPLCNYFDSIKLYQEEGVGSFYNTVTCIETICVIDDITLKVVDSEGKIDFKQICKGCHNQAGNCLCIIDTSVKGILDKIDAGDGGSQDPASFKQVCPGAQCYSVNDEGVYTELKCNPNNGAYTNQDPFFGYNGDGFLRDISDEDKLNDNDYLGMFFITIILIIFLIIAFIGLHDIDTQIKKQAKIKPTVKPKMTFELNPKYTPGKVNPINKTKYAPLS